MEHVKEKRGSVRHDVFVPAKVESNSRERLVKVTDLSLDGCKIVCASGQTNLNLKSSITITFFEEKLIKETNEHTGLDEDKIQLHGCQPLVGEVIRWFKRNKDTSVSVYGIKFSHTIDYQHPVRQIIADSSH